MADKYSVEAILKATGVQQFAEAFKNAAENVQSFESSTNKATGGTKNMMSGIGKIVAGIGITKALSAGFNLVKNSVGGAVDRFDTLERYPKVMEQLGFSTDDSTKSMNKLSEGIQGLPTALNEVASTAQNIAILTGDLEGATDTTLALNNAFLASGASTADANRGLQQYVQMLSKGEVDLQSWRTLQETMGLALNDVAKAFGFAGESAQNDLYAALKDGSITFDEFNNKLIELDGGVNGFAEKAKTASKGLKTSWQNIKTAVVTGVANMIAALNDGMIAAGFGSIADNLDKVKVAVQSGFKAMVESVGPFIGKLGELWTEVSNSTAFDTLKTVMQQAIDKFGELRVQFMNSAFLAMVKEEFSGLKDAILEIDFVKIVDGISSFLDKWGPLIAGITGGIVTFKILTSVLTGFVAVAGAINSVNHAIKGFQLAIGVFGGIKNAAIVLIPILTGISWPIIAVVAAMAALVAAGVLLWQNWDTVKEKAGELKQKAIDDFNELKEGLSNIFNMLKQKFIDDWNEIGAFFTETIPAIVEGIVTWFAELPAKLQTKWDEVLASVVAWSTSMWEKATEMASTFIQNVLTFFDELPEKLGFALGFALGTVASWAVNMWNKAIEVGTNFITTIVEWFTQLPARISEFVTNAYNNVTAWASNMWAKAKETGTNFLNAIVQFFTQLPGKISNFITTAYNNVVAWASNMWSKAKETGRNFITGVVDFVKQLPGKIKTFIDKVISDVIAWGSNLASKGRQGAQQLVTETSAKAAELPGKMLEVGTNLVKGLWQGITNAKDWVMGKIGGFMDGIVAGVKKSFKVKSPSRVFMEIGNYLDEGLVKGIEKGASAVHKTMGRMIDGVIAQSDKGATFDINGSIARSNAQVKSAVSHELKQNTTAKQPANLTFNLGNKSYRAFVDDISNTQNAQIQLTESYL